MIDPRTVPVRFSALRSMARSALHYHDACQADSGRSLAMRLGAANHAVVFDQPFAIWGGKDRRAKGYADFAAAQPQDVEILTGKEHVEACAIRDAIRGHRLAAPLLFDAEAIIEQRIDWSWLGRSCRSTPDSRNGSVLVDLKTTRDASPDRFSRDALFRGYNAQLAFYALAVEAETGKTVRDCYLVAVESKRPFAVTVLRLTDEARLAGEKLCRTWMERVLVCEASNEWPAYSQSVVALDVQGDVEITINGEPAEWE